MFDAVEYVYVYMQTKNKIYIYIYLHSYVYKDMYIDTVFTYLSGMVFTYKAKQVTRITSQIPNNLCLKSLV